MTNERYGTTPPTNEAADYRSFDLDDLKDINTPITFQEYLKKQEEIILGKENREKTASALGYEPSYEPSRNDLGNYFVDSGQAAEFRKKYFHRIIPRKAS